MELIIRLRLFMGTFILFLLVNVNLSAQNKYWLNFVDDEFVETHETINPLYLEKLEELEIEVLYYSSWLNAVSVSIDSEQIAMADDLDFIDSIEPVGTMYAQSYGIDSILVFSSRKLEALKYQAFQEAKIDGSGVKIGVLDAGFLGYEESSFSDSNIGDTKNFIEPTQSDLSDPKTYNFDTEKPDGLLKTFKWFKARIYHSHGTIATELIAGKTGSSESGLAPKAELYLGKTEEGLREYKAEEDHWIAGLEWLHSQGVRLVNTSLGYTKKREDRSNNYKPADMDGSSMIARAAQKAVEEKNMILVISAGNDGGNPFWRILSTPADAKDVISVGATKPHSFMKEKYSSIGPDFLDYVKPDVSAISPNGTSFSAPLITGFIGCMLQVKPDLSPAEVKNLLERSSQLFPYKNNYVGYGLPQADKVLALLDNSDIEVHEAQEVKVPGRQYTFPQERYSFITVFHKKDNYFVKHQERIKVEEGEFTIKRKKGAQRSTVLHGRKVIEIYWE